MTQELRLSTVDELAAWMGAMLREGAVRFELWLKPRGEDIRRVLSETGDPLDLADAFLAHTHGDLLAQQGLATYAARAYRRDGDVFSYVFLVPSRLALAGSSHGGMSDGGGNYQSDGATRALAALVTNAERKTDLAFTSLQRENEHQRRTNESILRTSTGTFEMFAKSYERTFEDLQERLATSLNEAAEQRARIAELEKDNARLVSKYGALSKSTKLEEMQTEAKLKTERERDKLLGNVVALISPLVMAKMFNKPIDAAAVAGPAVGAFLTSLTKEQEKALLGALDVPQQLIFMEILKARNAAAEADKKKNGSEVGEGATPPISPPQSPVPAQATTTAAADKAESFNVGQELERITRFANTHTAEFLQWLGKIENWAESEQRSSANDMPPTPPANDDGVKG